MTTTKSSDISRNSEAYNTGYEAARQGEPRSANPYAKGTIDAANWLAGWLAGWIVALTTHQPAARRGGLSPASQGHIP